MHHTFLSVKKNVKLINLLTRSILLSSLVDSGTYDLDIEMTDMDDNIRRISYTNFKISVADYSITTGDAVSATAENEWGLRDDLKRIVGFPFVTTDQTPNDCLVSKNYRTAGW